MIGKLIATSFVLAFFTLIAGMVLGASDIISQPMAMPMIHGALGYIFIAALVAILSIIWTY